MPIMKAVFPVSNILKRTNQKPVRVTLTENEKMDIHDTVTEIADPTDGDDDILDVPFDEISLESSASESESDADDISYDEDYERNVKRNSRRIFSKKIQDEKPSSNRAFSDETATCDPFFNMVFAVDSCVSETSIKY